MSRSKVGRWGKNLAIRVPFEVAKAAGLSEGEQVELEAQDTDIVIRRSNARARADALAAAEALIRHSRKHVMDARTRKELLDEGRRE